MRGTFPPFPKPTGSLQISVAGWMGPHLATGRLYHIARDGNLMAAEWKEATVHCQSPHAARCFRVTRSPRAPVTTLP
jgi:hypothetical protein